MKKLLTILLLLSIFASVLCTSCTLVPGGESSEISSGTSSADTEDTSAEFNTSVDSEQTEIPEDLESDVNTLEFSFVEGTEDCWSVDGQTVTFSGIASDTVVSVCGELNGQIVIDVGDDYKFELQLCGVKLYSSDSNPIEVLSGSKVTLTAKKDTQNYIYDQRAAVTSSDDDSIHTAAIWSKVDLEISGKGELVVISEENNGIHSSDSLEVQNLTLSVTCMDNALKGNDSVDIDSGTVLLISKSGDGIKTESTDISEKGNQRGTVRISGGSVTIYAGSDGIDAAYNAEIDGSTALSICTAKYSSYSEDAEVSGDDDSGDARYIRFTSSSYSYSVKYYNSDSDYAWANATYYKSVSGGRSTYYYYKFAILDGYDQVQFYIYSSDQKQGQDTDYLVQSDYMTWNTSYDTFALEQRGTSLSYNWTNYSSSADTGWGGGGWGDGMSDGNTDKADYSAKGIKAGNEIHITGGAVSIKAYDDAIHANNETALENGSTPTGDVYITAGTLTLYSNDDGIHADGDLTISGGTVEVTNSYEGLEGVSVTVSGGDISVISSDDGINSTASTGTGVTFDGGTTYVYAGGDGIDANSKTSYTGIVFNAGTVTVINTSSNNSSIDTEQGYAYNGGTVLALCPSSGMSSEVVNCKNFSSVGTRTTLNLKSGQTVSAKVGGTVTVSVTMPCQLSALVVYLGSSSASIQAS